MQRASGHPLRTIPAVRRARAIAFATKPPQHVSHADDVRLFAMFFLGGFTFVTVYLL